MHHRRFWLLPTVLVGLFLAATSLAEDAVAIPPNWQLNLGLASRANPAGLMLNADFGRLWSLPDPTGPARTGDVELTYLKLGATVGANPAYAQVGAYVEVFPFPFFGLRAQADMQRYFGANGALLEFPTAEADYSPERIGDMGGQERTGSAWRFLVAPTLRARFGRILVNNRATMERFDFRDRGPWLYEWEHDTLLAARDWVITVRSEILYSFGEDLASPGWCTGPAWDLTRADGADRSRIRLAWVTTWRPRGNLGVFQQPWVFAKVGTPIRDRYREGNLFVIAGVGGNLSLGR